MVNTKRCADCGNDRPLADFPRSKRYRLGRFCYCRFCQARRYKIWVKNNPDKKRAQRKRYRERHPERVKLLGRASYLKHRDKNKEKANARQRDAYHKNLEKSRAYCREKRKRYVIKRRAYARKYIKERGRCDPLFKIRRNLSSRLAHCLQGRLKSAPFWKLVGCSKEELRRRLQSAFKPGMSWKNYGSVWHVDHIKPCIKFDLTDPAQQRACFHYTNLQPLFAQENLSKGDFYA